MKLSFVISASWLACSGAISMPDVPNEVSRPFEKINGYIGEFKNEISAIVHKLGNELTPNLNLSMRDRHMYEHFVESLSQAEQAAKDALDKSVLRPHPMIGKITRTNAHYQLSSQALRYVGMCSLAVIVGNAIHFAVCGFFASISIMMLFFSTIPMLFSSIMMFPSMLLLLENVLGLSLASGFLSYTGFATVLNFVDRASRSSTILEYLGAVTVLMGTVIVLLKFAVGFSQYYSTMTRSMNQTLKTNFSDDKNYWGDFLSSYLSPRSKAPQCGEEPKKAK